MNGELGNKDTREQLEADIRKAYWCLSGQEIKPVFTWLDRQAAITEREVLCQPDERDEQIAELTAERDYWKEQHDKLMKEYKRLERYYEVLSDDLKETLKERDYYESLTFKEY